MPEGNEYDHEDVASDDYESQPAAAYVPDHSVAPEANATYADEDVVEENQATAPPVDPPADAAPLMPASFTWGLFGACALLIIIGWLCRSSSAIPNFIISLLFTTAALTIFRSLKTKRWILHSCILGGVALAYLLGLFLVHKQWVRSFENFGEYVVSLTQKTGDAVSSGSAEDKKTMEVPVKIAGTSIKAAQGFLAISAWNKFKMFWQLFFFSASILLFSLTVVHATPGLGRPALDPDEKGFMSWFGPISHRCVNAIGAFSLARIIKALVICIVCMIGLKVVGIRMPLFIAGSVFCFALVSYLSPGVALVLGGIVLWAVEWSWSSAGGLVILCIVLGLVEKWLFWVLKRIPMFRLVVAGPGQGSGAVGKTMGAITRAMPHVVSLAVFGLLIYFVVTVYGVYEESQAREKDLQAAENLYETQDWQGAFDAYKEMFGKYPNHPGNAQLAVEMLKCRLKQGELERATYIAQKLSDWPEDESLPSFESLDGVDSVKAGSRTVVASFKREVHKFLSSQASDIPPGKGYELIIRETVLSHKPLRQPDPDKPLVDLGELDATFGELGRKLVELDKDNPWGYVAAGYGALAEGDGQAALEASRNGIKIKKSMRELHVLQGDAYLFLKQFDQCDNRCKFLLDSDKEDFYAVQLLARMLVARGNAEESGDDGGGAEDGGTDETDPEEPGDGDTDPPATE